MKYHSRLQTTLTPSVALLALTACAGSTASALIERPQESMMEACPAPVSLPAREAAQLEVERWWGADRARLVECASRHAALADWADRVTQE